MKQLKFNQEVIKLKEKAWEKMAECDICGKETSYSKHLCKDCFMKLAVVV